MPSVKGRDDIVGLLVQDCMQCKEREARRQKSVIDA
jgi:hypothetical protein